MAVPKLEIINVYKTNLTCEFEMKDKGKLKHFLGLEIDYDRSNGMLKINQNGYALGSLKRFNETSDT